jgi:hypothetical protein
MISAALTAAATAGMSVRTTEAVPPNARYDAFGETLFEGVGVCVPLPAGGVVDGGLLDDPEGDVPADALGDAPADALGDAPADALGEAPADALGEALGAGVGGGFEDDDALGVALGGGLDVEFPGAGGGAGAGAGAGAGTAPSTRVAP